MVIGYSLRKLLEANKTKEILFLTGVRNERIRVSPKSEINDQNALYVIISFFFAIRMS